MEIRQLQIFCHAANTLNFTKTAEQLGYVQSNITSQIHKLEEELNTKLFERFHRKLQLTHEGRHLLKNAQAILQLYNQTQDEFLNTHVKGSLHIGSPESLCVYRLPKLLTAFRSAYPSVNLQVTTEQSQQLYHLLRNNLIDIAFLMDNTAAPADIQTIFVYKERLSVIVGPQHALAHIPNPQLTDLNPHCFIISPPGCGLRPYFLSTLAVHDYTPSTMMELSSAGAIKECTACNLGVAILPHFAVAAEIRQGKLVELHFPEINLMIDIHLAYHRDKWLSPVLQSFLALAQGEAPSR